MRRLLSVACAAFLLAGAAVGGLVGCSEPAAAPAGDTTYKCAMAGCTKTKAAKPGDPAPS